MARVTVEDCLERVENRFRLGLILAFQENQGIEERRASHHPTQGQREVVMALREIAAEGVEGRVPK